ncbi:hypothetical protein EXQ37_03380 [Clostridium botulinum]|nr:hypothetical protein [Clostridium botulinum]MBO0530407.1 hypothetical protein [Clostridium botulinum]MBO0538486.1 hypothetical protein [Clostridium botulinum]MBO0550550.1 hypothetical protein [Clostridium botulinum]MBO0555022.1 hypothetical protein [Clostridium botulinum]MBO0558888.1 hypothetical protein [Clostridium botulinum]
MCNEEGIEVIVKIVGTEKYYVKNTSDLNEAIKIIRSGDNSKYDLVEQDLDFVSETFEEC